MASSPIHLAIAKNYLRKYNELDKEQVLIGTIYPDTVKDKNISHYADLEKRGKDNVSNLQGKVNLYSFLQEHGISNSFEFGWFIHLVTDYLFFDELFTPQYLLTHSFLEFRRDLYYAYDCLTNYLLEKYGITIEDYTIYPSEFFPGKGYHECLFTFEIIDNFIIRVSSINVEEYVKKIKLAKRNIKPY